MQRELMQYPLFKNDSIQSVKLLNTQGFCNENYLVQTEKKRYLLRKFKLDNNRQREFKVQKLAYKKYIAAKPWILDEENALMICDFVEGYHKDTIKNQDLIQLSKVVRKLHTITLREKALDVKKLFTSPSREVKQAFNILKKYRFEKVLCHNDLNLKNILFSQSRIKLIDWEFSEVNDRYFDLACVCVEYKLNKKMQKLFLERYFKSTYSLEKLEAYKTIYIALCKQWFENLKPTPPSQT